MADTPLAAQLARALDGERTGVDEADRLARLLRDAAGAVRFDVTAEQTEQALRRMPALPPSRRRPRWPLALAAVAVPALIAAAVVVRGGGTPGIDLTAQARAAVREVGAQYQVRMRMRSPGSADRLFRTQWVAPDGRTRVRVRLNGRVIEDALREPGGRVVAYQGNAGRVAVAPSCRSLAGMCSELINPIDYYRERIARTPPSQVESVRLGGRPAYRLVLPAQSLGKGTTPVDQVVYLDATTLLPQRIIWREQTGGHTRVTAVIDVLSIEPLASDDSAPYRVDVPKGTPLVELDAAGGGPVGAPTVKPLTLAQAREQYPGAYWLGRRYQGVQLTGIRELRWPSGRALAVDYGGMRLWSFDRVIPAELVDARLLPLKLLTYNGVIERFYVAAGARLAAERDLPGWSVAVVAPQLDKLSLFAALAHVRPLAPPS